MVGLVVAVMEQLTTGLTIQINDGGRSGSSSTHGAGDSRGAMDLHMDMVL